MNNRDDEILKGTIQILIKYLNLSKIILFGSRVKLQNKSHSDFDFAVDEKKPHVSKERKINEELEKICGLHKIDVIYIPSVDKDFKEIILTTGKVIYEKRD